MYPRLFAELRAAKLPVSLREYLGFLEALDAGLAEYDAEGFYYLARAALVKDERLIDRFDRVFAKVFGGLESHHRHRRHRGRRAPRRLAEEARRGAADPRGARRDRVARRLRGADADPRPSACATSRAATRAARSGSAPAGTSPFGAFGYNPEGVRIGQDDSPPRPRDQGLGPPRVPQPRRQRRARHPQHQGRAPPPAPLGPRGRRRRARPRRRPSARPPSRAGSTSSPAPSATTRSRCCSSSTSAARWTRTSAWSRSCSRPPAPSSSTSSTSTSTTAPTRASGATTAAAGTRRPRPPRSCAPTAPTTAPSSSATPPCRPTRSLHPGGANEHWNAETGETWLKRLLAAWPHAIWINPTPEKAWGYSQSVAMIADIFTARMYPLTLAGLEAGIRDLAR